MYYSNEKLMKITFENNEEKKGCLIVIKNIDTMQKN